MLPRGSHKIANWCLCDAPNCDYKYKYTYLGMSKVWWFYLCEGQIKGAHHPKRTFYLYNQLIGYVKIMKMMQWCSHYSISSIACGIILTSSNVPKWGVESFCEIFAFENFHVFYLITYHIIWIPRVFMDTLGCIVWKKKSSYGNKDVHEPWDEVNRKVAPNYIFGLDLVCIWFLLIQPNFEHM